MASCSKDFSEHKQSYAVNRLLEVSQKRKLLEQEWKSSERRQYNKSSKSHFAFSSKSGERKRYQQLQDIQKSVQKQRMKRLIQQTINNEEDSPVFSNAKGGQKDKQDVGIAVKFLRNTKLRPFNSNLTFYSMKKGDKQRNITSSLSFYKQQTKKGALDKLNNSSYKFVKSSQMDDEDRYKEKKEIIPNNHIVYFKPNKSETVRELLNQMKHEKLKNNDVILNSTQRNYHPVQQPEPEPDVNIFSQQQIRIIARYKKFVPFQKDENLIWKKMLDGDNIWLKRFKESWQRRKSDQEGRKSNFKRLIVNN